MSTETPTILEDLRSSARRCPKRVVFPESSDPRVVAAANQLALAKLARVVVLNPPEGTFEPSIEFIWTSNEELRQRCATQLFENRKGKGLSREGALEAVEDPLIFAALMVRLGVADVAVAGSLATTASVIRAGLYGIGTAPGRSLISSFFLMQLTESNCVAFADCGVVPDPTPQQLAEIAMTTAENFRRLSGETARVAMLSFSTFGSADHPRVNKVREATRLAQALAPDLLIDGELQFDAAFDPEVGRRKAPNSPVAGKANVFVFPDLDSGNIGYKIAQRIGLATAIGPLVQGLRHPMMDLSRGCSVQDIIDVSVVASRMT
jgi:phosphate acetyltransferase